jgi:hypothetical protein
MRLNIKKWGLLSISANFLGVVNQCLQYDVFLLDFS